MNSVSQERKVGHQFFPQRLVIALNNCKSDYVAAFLRSSGSGTGPLSLVSTTEELLGRNSRGSCLENR
jgi:hypothetical protein